MTARQELALGYAKAGYTVFPVHEVDIRGVCTCRKGAECGSPGKHPRIDGGFKGATSDEATVRRWWSQWPNANIGIATGRPSGVFAVDVDKRSGGYESLERWEAERGELPATLTSLTGGGGRHLFYRYPQDGDLPGRINWIQGVDIKSDGGYVVAPGSNHAAGAPYQWRDVETPIAEAPSALLSAIREASGGTNGREPLPSPSTILAGIPEGRRDETLFRYACQLRRRYNDQREEIEVLVLEAARRCVPPFPDDQALAKVEQAFKQDHTDDANGSAAPDGLPLTHGGNGKRFARLLGARFLYLDGSGWRRWDGSVWEACSESQMEQAAQDVVDTLRVQLGDLSLGRHARNALNRWIDATDSPQGLRSMLAMARLDRGLFYLPDDVNKDPDLLPVANGVVNLRTGELRPASRHDLFMAASPYRYDPNCPTPRWLDFLMWAMGGDEKMVAYLQRLVGYSATGLHTEHIFPMLIGGGGNGKSTFVETIMALLGSMAVPFPAEALTGPEMSERHTELLRGARLAITSETNARAGLNSATVKSYTGDELLTARKLYQDLSTFPATHTNWFVSNSRPKVSDDSDGFWRRARLIRFDAVVEPGKGDPELKAKFLKEEGPGILAWIVRGATLYYADGLDDPRKVRAATDGYREDEDLVMDFINDCLSVGPQLFIDRRTLKVLYDAWCEGEGIERRERLGMRELVASIGKRVEIDPNAVTGGRRGIVGIGSNLPQY